MMLVILTILIIIMVSMLADMITVLQKPVLISNSTNFRDNVSNLLMAESLLSDWITAADDDVSQQFFFKNEDYTINSSWTPELEGANPQLLKGKTFKNPFVIPQEKITPKWSLILGSFTHIGDENWDDFLVATEVPGIVRLFLSLSSEDVTIRKLFKNDEDYQAVIDHPAEGAYDSTSMEDGMPYQVLLTTSTWLLTHKSRFRLQRTYPAVDFDGTSSENTFYMLAPWILVHDIVKPLYHTTIFRVFDQKGCNMTWVDRQRNFMAQRFFRRISS